MAMLTTGPLRSLQSIRMMPLLPRFWVRNSSIGVRFVTAFKVTCEYFEICALGLGAGDVQ